MYAATAPRGFFNPQQQQMYPQHFFPMMGQPQNWIASGQGMPMNPAMLEMMAPHTVAAAEHLAAMSFQQLHPTSVKDRSKSPLHTDERPVENFEGQPLRVVQPLPNDNHGHTSSLPLKKREMIAAAAAPAKGAVVAKKASSNSKTLAGWKQDGKDAKVRTYPCPMCDRVFSNSSNRARHKRVHTGEKP